MNGHIQTKGHIHMEEKIAKACYLVLTYLMLDDGLIGSDLQFIRSEPRSLTSVLPHERWTNPRSKGNQEKTNSHLLYLWSCTIFCEFFPLHFCDSRSKENRIRFPCPPKMMASYIALRPLKESRTRCLGAKWFDSSLESNPLPRKPRSL